LPTAVAVIGCCAFQSAALAQSPSGDLAKRQADEVAGRMHKLTQLVDLAEKTCLSNRTSTDSVSLLGTFKAIKERMTSGVGLERQAKEVRGASEQLTGAVAQLENDQIRKCINEIVAPAFAQITANFLAGDSSVAWPEPIDFRFRFARVTSKDPAKYSENLRVALLRSSRSPVTRRITFQPDAAGPYYQLDIPYPASSELIKGTIAPEIIATSTLSTEPTSLTPICLQRPSSFPQVKAEYDVFECIEGDVCRSPAFGTTGWLAICPKSGEAVPPVKPSRYADFLIARAQAATVERRWVVPSLETLSERNAEGVGYTVFTLSTAAFRKPEALGVEVDVRVNGTRVEEDGLPPAMRPVANDPAQPFRYSFALQSLGFQGLHGGCDEISVGLTPVYGGGRKGDAQTVTLSYAALRDVEERKVPFAGDTLTWWASYITPAREWRFYPIVHSYIYSVNDPKQAASAAAKAEADRRWLDEQRFSYQGQRVLGVVRPPRTIKEDGTAAFGLAAGLLQPTGQIRFTFPQADARSMADFMVQQRRGGEADRVIGADKYVFQALGGYRTVKGVCGTG
jgi:hypothetical protein